MTAREIHWRQVKHHWEIYLFVVPTLVLIGLFVYYPAASGVFHSFFRWNGADISEFVGIDNYQHLLRSTEFWRSFQVAFILGLWNVVKMIPALLVAVCIHRCRSSRMQFFYRTMFVVPMVIPGLVIVLIWRSFFFEATSGYLNQLLHATGLMKLLGWWNPELFGPNKNPAWLGDPRLILVACIVWGFPWVGSFAVLTHLAKLQGISKDVYEAAEIDGVNWWTKFTRIELPLIMGSIYLLLVFVIIDTLKDAGMILALAGMQGGPGGVVTVPALFMIRKAFIEQALGYACAVGIILTTIVITLQKSLTWLMTAEKPWLVRWRQHRLRAKALRDAPANAVTQPCRPPRVIDPRLRRLGGWFLRGLKHAFIWAVLAFAFLPLYLMIIVSATVLTLCFALCAAYFFARLQMPLSRLFWNAILILMMMPMIANLVPLFRLLGDLNLLNTLTALILVGGASGQVVAIFVLRNFVGDIPGDLYEAAEIDGANHFQQLRHVVLPLSGPILGTVGVMQFIHAWNEFVLPLIVMRDHARLPVMVQLLRMAGEYIKFWGPLMAGYALAAIPIIILFIFSMKLFVRGLTEGAVKG